MKKRKAVKKKYHYFGENKSEQRKLILSALAVQEVGKLGNQKLRKVS